MRREEAEEGMGGREAAMRCYGDGLDDQMGVAEMDGGLVEGCVGVVEPHLGHQPDVFLVRR